MAYGAGLKQIVVVPAGLPGLANSCYSAKVTVTVTTGATGAATVIADIGLLLIMPNPASVSIQLQESSGTWTDVIPASTTAAHLIFSDATNLRVKSASTSTDRNATYYIIQ